MLSRLLTAPHRLAFFAGACLLGLAALWWGGALAAQAAGLDVAWAVRPGTAHALVMTFGFMPFFIIGFLFTAGPRWLGLEGVPARRLLLPVGTMAAGWVAAATGFHLSEALAGLGLAAVAVGFALAVGLFGLMVLDSPVEDRDHAKLVLLGCTVGVAALWSAGVAVVLRHDAAARAAAHTALWGCFALVFATVSHRMVPFFTAAAWPALDAWRPRALLLILAALVGLQAPWAAAQVLHDGRLPAGLAMARAAIELPGGLFLLWMALRWGLVQSLKIRLLAMLHMGFFWLGVAMVLGGLSDLLAAASDGQLALGPSPVHALGMGYLGSTMLAMVTRVACGQSGRAVVADNWAWLLFWAAQGAVVARVAAAMVPPGVATALALLAAQLWLAAVGAWALRYGRWFLQARVDGRPG